MNSAVDFEVLFLAECLAAGGKLALEGLGTIVQMHVRTKSDPAQEGLAAAWERACKGFIGLTWQLLANL